MPKIPGDRGSLRMLDILGSSLVQFWLTALILSKKRPTQFLPGRGKSKSK